MQIVIFIDFEQVAQSLEEVDDATAMYSEEFHTLTLCVKVKNLIVRDKCIDERIWKELRDHLPHYVLPDSIVPIKSVPMTKHGICIVDKVYISSQM